MTLNTFIVRGIFKGKLYERQQMQQIYGRHVGEVTSFILEDFFIWSGAWLNLNGAWSNNAHSDCTQGNSSIVCQM